MMTSLIERIRDRKGNPKGVLCAAITPDNSQFVGVGWSLCAPNDRFDYKKGKLIAERRAASGSGCHIPHSVTGQYKAFVARSKRYFKDRSVIGAKQEESCSDCGDNGCGRCS